MRKTTDMLLIELRDTRRRDIRRILRDTYAEEGSLERAGKRVGIDASTYCRWVKQLNVRLPRGWQVRQQARIR